MNKYITAGIFFLITSIVISFSYRPYSLLIIVLATFLGYTIARIGNLQKELQQLREALARDWEERKRQTSTSGATEDSEEQVAPVNNTTQAKRIHTAPIFDTSTEPGDVTDSEVKTDSTFDYVSPHTETTSAQPDAGKPPPLEETFQTHKFVDQLENHIKNFFTGGNLFVRIGILLLFFGVSFLIKYVSDQGMFPIEYRLMGVATGAIALLLFGWRIRSKKAGYALLLQGAGIGILYLVIFAAFSMYQLIPPLPAFVLLFIVGMFAAALAVLQNSLSLAVLGFSGGFLAPVLASSGSGDHVGLFSYYAILNAALVAVAWFKAWRPLNLLGFVFTFIIGSTWGFFDYRAEKFSTTEPFLILFFLFYVLIAVLFALRQPPKLRGYVDGTLLFGVPLAASALQYFLVRDMEYGVALSSFGFGAFYILLALILWKKAGDGLRLLSEAFLALGVIFASLAIPFALAPAHTAAAWGLEGLGLIWLGTRQNRLSVRMFGLLLQLGAAVLVLWQFAWQNQGLQQMAFINSNFISAVMLAVAGIFSARLLYREYAGKQQWETMLSPILLVWGLLWLCGGFINQIYEYYSPRYFEHSLLGFASILSIIFTITALRTKPVWQHSWFVAIALLPAMILTLIYESPNPASAYGWSVWPFAFAAFYWLLRKLDDTETKLEIIPWLHTIAFLLVVLLLAMEANWIIETKLQLSAGWQIIWWAIPAVLGLNIIKTAKRWPFSHHANAYQQNAGIILAAALVLWGVIAIMSRGDSNPVTWVPVLNPVDIMLGVVVMTLVSWWKNSNKIFETLNIPTHYLLMGLAGLVFTWLNFSVFRISYHWFNVSYNFDSLFDSSLTQTTISILWALTGVIITVIASRKNLRPIWIAGGVLLALVVLKLLLIDLSELSGIGRIISFLIVGSLLTSIGYFAPLPGDEKTGDENNESVKPAKQTETNEQHD